MTAAQKLTAEQLLGLVKRRRTIVVDLTGDGTKTELVLESVGRKTYDELVDAHPAADGSTDGYPFDRETFYPALIAASLVGLEEPLTPDQAAQLFDEWPMPVVKELINAAIELSASRNTWSPDVTTSEDVPA